MEEKRDTSRGQHKVALYDRQGGTINGVIDVVSFDVSEILLETGMGRLAIKGRELHVSRLSLEKGEVDMEGRIDSLVYSDAKSSASKESIMARLFG
jgi:sporulation protein YabP